MGVVAQPLSAVVRASDSSMRPWGREGTFLGTAHREGRRRAFVEKPDEKLLEHRHTTGRRYIRTDICPVPATHLDDPVDSSGRRGRGETGWPAEASGPEPKSPFDVVARETAEEARANRRARGGVPQQMSCSCVPSSVHRSDHETPLPNGVSPLPLTALTDSWGLLRESWFASRGSDSGKAAGATWRPQSPE